MADEEIQEPSEEQPIPVSEEAMGDGQMPVVARPDSGLTASPIVTDGPEPAERPAQLPFPIVGIGGSAGGVEAYIELFEHLPSSTGMAFVIVPHLSADQRSYLPEILARHTRMEIAIIENGMRPEPDHVYILPPNARVSLQNGAFHLEVRPGEGTHRPIDFFFRSLASEQGNFGIGVVLSGMDADGSVGLKTIKSESGISIVQSPESARFPDMPRSSISADHVDMVLPPDRIARYLAQLGTRFGAPALRGLEEGVAPREEQQHFGRILKLLRGVSGVDFRQYKPDTLQRRIARRMLMLRVDTLADYASFLQGDNKELHELHEDVLINVTRFFRDPEAFDALKNVVFSHIFEDWPPEHQLRVWVPGCSSGEEVYSIAMCLLEFLTGNTGEPPIQIFGTDASELSIQKARAGLYPEAITNEVSPERLRRFFIKTEKGYQVAKRIRDLCIFARQNLCNDPPFSRLDLISCRNVLIYFGPQLQEQLIPTFHYALRQDGFLFLGASETIREFTDLFRLTDRKNRIYSKIGTTPRNAFLDLVPRGFPELSAETVNVAASDTWGDLDIQRTADRLVLARYAPPGVVINEKLEILQSRGHTGPFLEMGQGTASLQLTRMMRESIASQVISAVKQAIERDLPVQVERLQVRDGDQIYETTLEVLPLHTAHARTRYFLVLFVPRSRGPEDISIPEISSQELSEYEKDRAIAQLRHDLSSTKLYLQSLLEERDARNQELISANEEIQSANEELQSTNEELETTKEELQSSNEELQTVNDELQNRNAALTQTSNDLQNLLNSVNLPMLMLNNEFSIRHFTPQIQRLMNVRSSDIGRPLGDIRLNLNVDNLEPLFAEVLDTLAAREIEVQDREGHWYLLRVRPYRTTDNKIDGVVVVLVDIDEQRCSQQQLRNARDFARSIIAGIPLPLAVVDSDFRIRITNEAFCKLASSTNEALERRFLPDLAAALWGMDRPLRSGLEGLRRNRGEVNSFEFEHKTSDDSARVFLVRGCPLQPDGERFMLITFENLTAHKEIERLLNAERKRLESAVESTTKELDRSREELRALTGSLMTSQEEERRRLARELHDDINQRLAVLSMDGQEILRNFGENPAAVRQKLQETLTRMGQLAEDVRGLSHRLHPSIIEDLGLAPALRSLTEEFGEREGMITTFQAEGVPQDLSFEVGTGLYRIAQEALRNIGKHAGRTHVKVTLRGNSASLELQVTDAGRGFDPESKRSGLGLISMEERARLIGATFRVQSAPGEGTKITVHVPLPETN